MDKNEFLSAITEIGSLEDIVEVRTKLTEISDNVSNIFDQNSELTDANKQLAEDNEKVRSANMQLFLERGTPKKSEDFEEKPEPKKIEKSFEELFNEKGAN